jgi:hypothetical protein
MHNIYVTLSCLRSSKELVLLQDITIEDLKKAKYHEGVLEYMSPEFYNNVQNIIIMSRISQKYKQII